MEPEPLLTSSTNLMQPVSPYALNTNKVIFERGKSKSKDVYYIPGYLRYKVKNFTEMNLDNLQGCTNATIIFNIYYGTISRKIVKKLLNNIILLFARDDAMQLTERLETNISHKFDKHQIQFTVRKMFKQRIQSDVFWSPFQIINLILSITVQPVVTKWGTVKINLMNHEQRFFKVSYSQEGTFGNYDLAEARMNAEYTNNRAADVDRFYLDKKQALEAYKQYLEGQFSEKGADKKIQHFQYAHFIVPLYKFPLVALATIFLPLWLLAIINMGIFFQDDNLADRIASIAALMIAFVALIPTIRAQIPPNPKLVFIQILVYLETLTSLFALIHSLDVRQVKGFNLVWYESGLFMISFIITIISVVIVFTLMILHYFYWQPRYNMTVDQQKKVQFIRLEWVNEECDFYFSKMNEILSKGKDKPKLIMWDDKKVDQDEKKDRQKRKSKQMKKLEEKEKQQPKDKQRRYIDG